MNMELGKMEHFVRNLLRTEGSGHDYYHVDRVRKVALQLAHKEGGCNVAIVEAAALLHDVADRKICKDIQAGRETIRTALAEDGFDGPSSEEVIKIIDGVSYRGAGVATPMDTLEGKVVQDADRLDALGAIGIARCFAYGGSKSRLIYDPEHPYDLHQSSESYHSSQGSSLNHFYEKLLLLKDRMQTNAGKRLAEKRHQFLEAYLKQFLSEWDARDLQD